MWQTSKSKGGKCETEIKKRIGICGSKSKGGKCDIEMRVRVRIYRQK